MSLSNSSFAPVGPIHNEDPPGDGGQEGGSKISRDQDNKNPVRYPQPSEEV